MVRITLWLAVALLAGLLATAALTISARSRSTRAGADLVIPPGREAEVMALLTPLRERGFAGQKPTAIAIEGSEIRVRMGESCAITLTYRPGGASGGLAMTWRECGDATRAEADALLADMASRDAPSIWRPASSGAAAPVGEGGILRPAAHFLGVPVSRAAVLGLLAGACGSVAAAWWTSRAPGAPRTPTIARRRAVLIAALALALAGGVLRARAAAQSPRDGDEVWALVDTHSIVTGDHDAWVHPPVFRGVQQRWAESAHVAEASPLVKTRALSLTASMLTLLLLAALAASQRSPWALAPLAAIALAPGAVHDGVLARPYALVSLCVTLVAAAAWWPGRSPGDRGLRVLTALLAAGLAMWTDLAAGLVAGLLCASMLAQSEWQPRRGPAIAMLLALSLWSAPLVPGAVQAMHTQVHPAADAGPDLRPHQGRRDFAPTLFAFGGAGFSDRSSYTSLFALLGLVLLVAPLRLGRRTRAWAIAPVLPASVILLFLLAGAVAVRTRNFLFLPYLAAFTWILLLGGASRAAASRESSSPPA